MSSNGRKNTKSGAVCTVSEFQFSILWRLLCLGGKECNWVLSSNIITGFPTQYHEKAKNDLGNLVTRGYIRTKNSIEELISIKPERFQDVKRIVDPDADPFVREIKPIEDQIPSGYKPRPFLTTKGSHRVKGVMDTYCFYQKKSDENFISVFLISDGKKKNTINLGSIYNKNSLYRKTLERIDKIFDGQGFTKAQMRDLGSDIVGNRQPPKALIDLMRYENYIIQKNKTTYERTAKKIPLARNMDKFMKKEKPIKKKPSMKKMRGKK